jgi:hypothetical protein
MNYMRLKDWCVQRVEDLVDMGVPRAEAEDIMHTVEFHAIAAEAESRSEEQFLLDFDRVGSAGMALRKGISEQAIRKRRTKILRNRNRRLRA